MFSRRFVTVSSEILKAVRHGDPVVALESTIITHGMPYPKNIGMALKIEKILKDKVAVINHRAQYFFLVLYIVPNLVLCSLNLTL